ncbi:MAG: S9 family peptidase, partial [Thermoplasmata archaeon]|nr:S9 family peptidase [Thermoplasmata archaeon]
MPEKILPPVAKKAPKRLKAHGDIRVDEYYWMKGRGHPDVLRYVEAENRYTTRMMKHTERLQKRLFKEMMGRISETDSSVPLKVDEYYYYTRTVKGKQYRIHCRKKGSLKAKEEIILDENEAAGKSGFFDIDSVKVSPDHNLLVYLADKNGSERFTLTVKDLRTGKLLKERIGNTCAVDWANDNRTIFYATLNEEWRADKVFRHVLGDDPKKDVLVFHEKDPKFYYLLLRRTKSSKFILITVESAATSEVLYLSADDPQGKFRVIKPRKEWTEYFVSHFNDKFFIVSNENAVNYKIMEAPDTDPSPRNWKEIRPHDRKVCIDVSDPVAWIEPFENHLVVFEREKAQGRVRVHDLRDGSSHCIEFPEKIFMAYPVFNEDPKSNTLRIKYYSLVAPNRIYDYDLNGKKLVLKKQDKVPGHDPSKYVQERIFAPAKDGTKVPITLVYRKGLKKDGSNPAYLYAYGAYGTFEWAKSDFDPALFVLLDRGFVYAYAHIRGGSDMGRMWHHEGRLMKKINSFTDFADCAEHLVKMKYTSPERLAIHGRSAGGLLMGSVVNMRPDLFRAVIAEVPFVDAISSMMDPTIPLTAGEFDEWGNPAKKKFYDYFKKYSPYDRVEAKDYPNMLVTGSLNDTRVQYWEPLKWVAKLRELKTDKNLLILRMGMNEGHAGASGRYDHL